MHVPEAPCPWISPKCRRRAALVVNMAGQALHGWWVPPADNPPVMLEPSSNQGTEGEGTKKERETKKKKKKEKKKRERSPRALLLIVVLRTTHGRRPASQPASQPYGRSKGGGSTHDDGGHHQSNFQVTGTLGGGSGGMASEREGGAEGGVWKSVTDKPPDGKTFSFFFLALPQCPKSLPACSASMCALSFCGDEKSLPHRWHCGRHRSGLAGQP